MALFHLGAVFALLLSAAAAQATFHEIKVREVHPSAGDSSYVELQMYEPGQTLLATHSMTVYSSSGTLIHSSTFAADVAKGENQRTALIGDTGVATAFGVTPDLVDSGLSISASGGAACWNAGGIPADCVAWGNFSGGSALEAAAGTSVGAPVSAGGIAAGSAIRRKITLGCATLLEDGDDTNDSATDFAEVTSLLPRNNNDAITETGCVTPIPPNTILGEPRPPARTASTEASFSFSASPAAEASFECRLDAEAFAACTSPVTYTGLVGGAGTLHTFQARAVHPTNGTDPTPASYSWTVDTQVPTVTIDSHPLDPSPGTSSAFTFHASEGASFQCSIEGPKTESFSLCSSGRTYKSLTDGSYTFKVRAIDQAQNQGPPQSFTWTVDNALADTTPPQTTITAHPPDPSDSANASFRFESNEAGSRFECKLDGAAFASCPTAGVSYAGLANGLHSFQVRAIDPSGNVDPTPAGFTFSVVAGAPPPVPVPAPRPSAPETRISTKPGARTHDRTPTLRFKASAPGASFECKLDGASFKPCRSTLTTKTLSFGQHTIKVRASAGGLRDPTPAQVSFKVVKG